MRDTARRWHQLMQGLGYERYGAQGGDFGAAVTAFMALADPEPLIGIHLHQIDTPPYVDAPATDAEREYLEARAAWDAVERGYSSIQSTKPQTVAYGLNDSPAGLAAYLIEKWRSWSHDLERIDRDVLLTNLTIFWATQTIAHLDARLLRRALARPPDGPTRPHRGPDRRRAVRQRARLARARRRASGPSGSSTSSAGRRCRAAATSRPPRSPSCSPATSPSSSARSPSRSRLRAEVRGRTERLTLRSGLEEGRRPGRPRHSTQRRGSPGDAALRCHRRRRRRRWTPGKRRGWRWWSSPR